MLTISHCGDYGSEGGGVGMTFVLDRFCNHDLTNPFFQFIFNQTCSLVIPQCCEKFEYWEDWSYAIWLNDDYPIDFYSSEARKSLLVLSKKPDYFELVSTKSVIYFKPSSCFPVDSPNNQGISFEVHPVAQFRGSYTISTTKAKLLQRPLRPLVHLTEDKTTDHKVLQTAGGLLPTLIVAENFSSLNGGKEFTENCEEFSWILKSSMEWETTNVSECYSTNHHRHSRQQRHSQNIRMAFCEAADNMMKILPLPQLGNLYEQVVELPKYNSKVLLTVQYVCDKYLPTVATDLIKSGALKWRSIESLNSKVYAPCYSILSQAWTIYASRTVKPSPGLYVGLYHLETTATSINILLPRNRRHMIPMIKVRENSELSAEEWQAVLETKQQSPEENLDKDLFLDLKLRKKKSPAHYFKYQLVKAMLKLQNLSRLSLSLAHIYDLETVELKIPRRVNNREVVETVRIILVVKPIRLIQESNILKSYAHHPRLAMYSFKHFETLHNHIYNPAYVAYRRKMLSYQTYLNEARQGILSCVHQLKLTDANTGSLTKELVITLLHKKAEELKSTWPTISWSVRVLEWDRARRWAQLGGTQKVHSASESHVLRANSLHKIILKNSEAAHFGSAAFDMNLPIFPSNMMQV
ncbi:hypothetical protein K493DRAFT_307129 [Basidiobolus meristosporus CBS 931.73]|uniref:Uncharacterized protein n=1 Tax=Basidiobolus meristosporus CBS 931.73 TaxID=1314790 RepID=A0A1Y1XK04_9FUNG|nr:hypothetical protein K493DRAFT_307129 [Basidiobolus meristosporus CBS 931.73]|eukprot:ORX86089.1 hypothetical protein K493DRAFT_307129 [Basidiobolus meristosporus CBS 931.73]